MAKLVLECAMYEAYTIVARQQLVIKTGNWDDLMKELPPSYKYPQDLEKEDFLGAGIYIWGAVHPENDEEQKELIRTGRIGIITQDGHPATGEEAIQKMS